MERRGQDFHFCLQVFKRAAWFPIRSPFHILLIIHVLFTVRGISLDIFTRLKAG